eukprot:g5857.t1
MLLFYPLSVALFAAGACIRVQQEDYEDEQEELGIARGGCSEGTIEALRDVPACSEGRCAICLDDWSVSDNVTRLPCQHTFCRDCIVTWLRHKDRCPLCNAPVEGGQVSNSQSTDEQRNNVQSTIEQRVSGEDEMPASYQALHREGPHTYAQQVVLRVF